MVVSFSRMRQPDKLAKFSSGKMIKADNTRCECTEYISRKNAVWCAESHDLEIRHVHAIRATILRSANPDLIHKLLSQKYR